MLGEHIKRLRTEKGLSQQELAEKLHVVRQTVSKWEKGLSEPDASMLSELAEVLGTTVTELLGESSPSDAASPSQNEGGRSFEANTPSQGERTPSGRGCSDDGVTAAQGKAAGSSEPPSRPDTPSQNKGKASSTAHASSQSGGSGHSYLDTPSQGGGRPFGCGDIKDAAGDTSSGNCRTSEPPSYPDTPSQGGGRLFGCGDIKDETAQNRTAGASHNTSEPPLGNLSSEKKKAGRNLLRTFLLCGGVTALLASAWQILLILLTSGFTNRQQASIGIIGGADGPTAIFVASSISRETGLFLLLLIAALCFFGFFLLRRKKK